MRFPLIVLALRCLGAAAPPTCNAGWPSGNLPVTIVNAQAYIGNTYRAGFPAQLDASASASGDGSILTYFWQQIPTLTGLTMQQDAVWSSHTTQKPTVDGLTAGPFDIQLTVRQADGQSATCVIYDGVVATDGNGTVIMPATKLGNAVQTIVGPAVRYQKNPWPFYDQATHDVLLTFAGNYNLGGKGSAINYAPTWDTPSTHGTILNIQNDGGGGFLLNGSPDTQFQIDFCGGAGNTSPPGDNPTWIALWYKTGRTNPDGSSETGRMNPFIDSCNSQTQLDVRTFDSAESGKNGWPQWPGLAVAPLSSQTNLQYGYIHPDGCGSVAGACWWDASAPPYYDPGQMFYEAYFRSGVDVWLLWAREWVDMFWRWPGIDRGVSMATGLWSSCWQSVACVQQDVGGLILRALDIDTYGGAPSMWPGLKHLYFQSAYNEARVLPQSPGNGGTDPRIAGATLLVLDYGAMFDNSGANYVPSDYPNGTSYFNIGTVPWPQFNRNAIHWTLAQCNSSDPNCANPNPLDYEFYKSWRDNTQHAWLNLYGGRSSPFDGTQLATVTQNSNIITCNNCGWTTADFTTRWDMHNGGSVCVSGPYCIYGPITFCHGTSIIYDSAECDNQSYCQTGGCTLTVNGQTDTLMLDRAYQGAGGQVNWIFPADANGDVYANQGFVVTGWGQTTLLEGVLGLAFAMASTACSGDPTPAGCGSEDASVAEGYHQDVANWVQNYALVPDYYGLSYLAAFPACIAGSALPVFIPRSNIACLADLDNKGSREILGDTAKSLMLTYSLNPTAGLKSILDNWYAGMWAKNNVGPIPSPDNQWDVQFDVRESACTPSNTYPNWDCDANPQQYGYFIQKSGALLKPSLSQKVSAQHFGISDQATWPAIRIGGVQPPQNVRVYFDFDLAGVPGAAKAEVTVTEPTGVVDPPVACGTTSCGITVNRTAGNYLVTLAYLSTSDEVLATSWPFVISVN